MSEKIQAIYETNIDYEASYQNMLDSKVVVAEITQKGLLWVRFFDTKTIFMFSTNGTLQVKWHNTEEKQILFNLLKKLLVAKEGQELKITPTKQLAWIHYRTPLKLKWCKEETEYLPKPKKPKLSSSIPEPTHDELMPLSPFWSTLNPLQAKIAVREIKRKYPEWCKNVKFNKIIKETYSFDGRLP